MNVWLAPVGAIATLLVAGLIVMWIIDGIETALTVVGITLACLVAATGITLFWIWVAGVL